MTSSDDPNYDTSDNTQGDNTAGNDSPTGATTNSDVEAFGDGPVSIPSNPGQGPIYTVQITTPTNEDNEPMQINLDQLGNVLKVIVTADSIGPQEVVREIKLKEKNLFSDRLK